MTAGSTEEGAADERTDGTADKSHGFEHVDAKGAALLARNGRDVAHDGHDAADEAAEDAGEEAR